MDLLSLVGQTTKRKGELISQAKDLAKKVKTQSRLERSMSSESKALVKSLRDKQIRWEEYSRSLVQKTLESALCSVYLGSEGLNVDRRLEEAWPTIIGDMLPPLVKFLAETKYRIDSGILLVGDQISDFADIGDLEDLPEELLNEDIEEYEPDGEDEDKKGKTWKGLFYRVERYLSTPVYSFMALGLHLTRTSQGYKEMRRIPKKDKRTCDDCRNFAELGWQPIGSLPLPGRKCQCYDRCRCIIQYR